MEYVLKTESIKKRYGNHDVLKGLSMNVPKGSIYGFIGKNGAGKTTAIRIICGLQEPSGGEYSIYGIKNSRRDILTSRRRMGSVIEAPAVYQDMTATDNVKMQFSILGLPSFKNTEKLLKIVGLENTGRKKVRNFSLGMRQRLGIAVALAGSPDFLVLDEPTNHLDMSMLQWLEEYLKNYKGTVLMVSHDRYFLDAAATRILEVEDGTAVEYLGNYSYYLEEKERRRQRQLDAYKEQQKKVKAMEKAIKDMRSWAAQADNESMYKRAASMQKRLDRMEKVERPKNEGPGMRVTFEEGERSGKDVLLLEGVAKSFGNKKLFSNLDLEVYYQEHVALLGRNGCGKTTLLRMILGELPADAGSIRVGASARIGYLPQQVRFPREDVSVLEAFRDGLVIGEGKAREELSRYLFTGESVFKKVENLSGGEKSRLYLARLMQTGVYTPGENSQGINFLILDEPTNHLDILSRENLETALEQFKGTLLIVSHDRYFLNKMADRMVEITQTGACSYAGNYEYYRQEKAKRAAMPIAPAQETENKTERRWETNTAPAKPATTGSGRNQYRQKQLEQEIRMLEELKNTCEADAAAAGTDYERLLELEAEKKRLENQIDEKMEEWLELTEG